VKPTVITAAEPLGLLLTLACITAAASAAAAPPASTQDIAPAHSASGKFRAHQDFLSRRARSGLHIQDLTPPGQPDELMVYAEQCRLATGIDVPAFNCDTGIDVPGQGNVPEAWPHNTTCDHPNVLNAACDPGSKFQVLPGRTADAVAVAHCRKNGQGIAGSSYNDIAVIQYNKKNGAICFYQALTNLDGSKATAPSAGLAAWPWKTPAETEHIGCAGCHDNGGFIRSEYLAQLRDPVHGLPNDTSGFDNLDTPLRYVGNAFAEHRSWSVSTDRAPGDRGLACNTCHRLAVPNRPGFLTPDGTAAHFANVATASSQLSKNPHSATSPIWMRPGQIHWDRDAEASASRFQSCAIGFFNSGFQAAPPGCAVTPLGLPWSDSEKACQGVSAGCAMTELGSRLLLLK
jgi:hypothetical protein